MSSEWKKAIFDDVVRLKRGYDLPNQNIVDGQFPVVTSSGIKARHHRYKAKPPGVVTGRSGTLGVVQYLNEKFWPLNTALYAKDFKGNDPKFVYYFLTVMRLENFNAGAGVPTLNQNHLHKIPVLLPPFKQQRKIAAILSVYDDLIENNKRRIAILENMAEEIYREWFVRFRFPGYQTAKFKKGIPKGWESRASDELLDVLSGGTPKTDNPNYWDGLIPFFTPKDANDRFYSFSTEKYITNSGLEKCNSKLYEKNTIFITARGTVGKLALAYVDMAMNQSCYALLPKDRKNYYFYFLSMRKAISHIKGVSKSGVFDNIVVDTFKIVPLLCPDQMVLNAFNVLITPIFDQMGGLSLQNENLVKAKQMLLPRLISGKFSVEALDIQFPPSMQEESSA